MGDSTGKAVVAPIPGISISAGQAVASNSAMLLGEKGKCGIEHIVDTAS